MHSQWEEGQGTAQPCSCIQPVLHRPRVGQRERRGRGAQLPHLKELWASPSMWEGWPGPCSKPTPLAHCSQDHPLPLQNQVKSFPKSAQESLDVPSNASCSLVTLPCACAGFPGKAQQTLRQGPGRL